VAETAGDVHMTKKERARLEALKKSRAVTRTRSVSGQEFMLAMLDDRVNRALEREFRNSSIAPIMLTANDVCHVLYKCDLFAARKIMREIIGNSADSYVDKDLRITVEQLEQHGAEILQRIRSERDK
jgi:hypothetical protein